MQKSDTRLPYVLTVGLVGVLPLLLSGSLWLLGKPGIDMLVAWGFPGLCVYTLVTAIIMGLALSPTTLVAIASGYLWGWIGLPAMVVAYLLAALIGRAAGIGVAQGIFPAKWIERPDYQHFIQQITQRPWAALIFARLSPALPFALTNLLLGSVRIPLRTYVGGTLLGMLPRSLVSFGIGVYAEDLWRYVTGAATRSPWEIALIIGLLAISVGGLWWVFKGKKGITNSQAKAH